MAYIMCLSSIPINFTIGRLTSSRNQCLTLSHMFVQKGAAHEYQLHQVLQGAHQGDMSMQNFHSLLSGYWEELQMEVSISDTLSDFAPRFSNLYHFVMHLRPEFEGFHGHILHRSPLSSLTEVVAEFTFEVTHFWML